MKPLRVLVVEDDPHCAELIKTWLRDIPQPRFEPHHARSLAEARDALIASHHFSAILLDRTLGDGDGLELLRQVRSRQATQDLAVLILSARAHERDVVVGLDHGADEYISKPCSEEMLRARLLAVLRSRRQITGSDGFLHGPGFRLDPVDGRLIVLRRVEHLEPKETELLLIFLRRPNVIHAADFLRAAVWGGGVLPDNTLEARMSSLRRKLGRRSSCLETVRGVGYRLIV